MNYEKYISIIPENTRKYVECFIRYLDKYSYNNNVLYDHYYSMNSKIFNYFEVEKLVCSLVSLLKTGECYEYQLFLKEIGFNAAKLNEELPDTHLYSTSNFIFTKYIDLFLIFDDELKYKEITPANIIGNVFKKICYPGKSGNYYFLSSVIESSYEEFEKSIEKLEQHEAKLINEKYENELYNNLSMPVIELINTASSIRSFLITSFAQNKIEESNYLINDDSYLVPLSLLMATNYSTIQNTKILGNYLSTVGISYKKILNSLNLPKELPQRNLISINELYKFYWKFKNIEESDVTVLDIIERVFDTNFTNSLAIKKILYSMDLDINKFTNIKSEYELFKKNSESKMILEEIKTGKDCALTIEENIQKIIKINVTELNIDNPTDILVYGNELFLYMELVNEVSKGISDNIIDGVRTDITSTISKIYQEIQVIEDHTSFWTKLIGKKDHEANQSINKKLIEDLKYTINLQLNNLCNVIMSEDEIGRYMEALRKKNLEYFEQIENSIILANDRLNKLDSEENYGEFIRISSIINALQSKKETFATTNLLLRQNIAYIYMSMQSVLETFIGLKLANDTLIPLIETSELVNCGNNKNNEGKEMTKKIISILNSVIDRNLNQLKQEILSIDDDSNSLEQILNNVREYINLLEQNDIKKISFSDLIEQNNNNIESNLVNSDRKEKKLYIID